MQDLWLPRWRCFMFSNCLSCDLIHPHHRCFVSQIMVSVLLLAHAAQEMPEWERWGINRARTREKIQVKGHCPRCAYFDRILPVSEDSFLASLAGSGSWISTLTETPVYAHTRIWLFSHSEVQAGGNKPFFPLWGIQHEHSAHACSLQSSGPVQQNFSTAWPIHSFNSGPHP